LVFPWKKGSTQEKTQSFTEEALPKKGKGKPIKKTWGTKKLTPRYQKKLAENRMVSAKLGKKPERYHGRRGGNAKKFTAPVVFQKGRGSKTWGLNGPLRTFIHMENACFLVKERKRPKK